MIKKKNYKKQEHFSETFSFHAASPNGKRYLVYYKRYFNQHSNHISVYQLINNVQKAKDKPASPYSNDRTLELISFDGNLAFLKKYLRKIGKIRIYDVGQGMYDGVTVYYALCVFKFEFDLVKCFREGYLQNLMNQESKNHNLDEEAKQKERYELIKAHMGQQLEQKVKKLEELQDEGFQVVTDIYGQYRMDQEANQKFVENLPQEKRKSKQSQVAKTKHFPYQES